MFFLFARAIFRDGSGADVSGTASHIANINPFRYRGYYYDTETGWYYLQNRYYDPETGRFLNADTVLANEAATVQGYNLFQYCFNNPVNRSDSEGHWGFWETLVAAVVTVVVTAVVVAAVVATAGAAGAVIGSVAAAATGSCAVGAAVTTAATAGGCIVAAGIAACALSDVGEMATGTNVIRDKVFDGDEASYRNAQQTLWYLGYSIIAVGSEYMNYKNTKSCFIAGTIIQTQTGEKEIEKIQVGDKVWSQDAETGERALKEVKQVFVRSTDELVHITINKDIVTTTPEHPFFVFNKGWVGAIHLRAGDILVTSNGKYVIVEKVQHEILEAPVTVYNFEVADFHTYFVGANAVLVHNTCNIEKPSSPVKIKDSYLTNNGIEPHSFKGEYVTLLFRITIFLEIKLPILFGLVIKHKIFGLTLKFYLRNY